MKFIQENLFFVIIVAVSLILCGLLFGVAMHFDSVFDEQLKLRSKLAIRIRNRQQKEPVNQNIIDEKKNYIIRTKKDVRDAQFQNVVWTTRNLKIPVLKLTGEGNKTTPALPYDRKIWRDNLLSPKYVSYYSKRINDFITPDGALKMLKITRPPIQKELDGTAAKRLEEILLQKAREARTGSTDGRKKPAIDDAGAKSLAMDYAVNKWKLRKAEDGVVFANYNSLNPIWQSGEVVTHLTSKQVWNAQIDLWIKEEVVRAMTRTIDEVFAENKVAEKERNVIRSPIKRILGVKVTPPVSAKDGGSSTGGLPEEEDFGRDRGGDGEDFMRRPRGGRRVSPVEKDLPVSDITKLTREKSNTIFEVYDYNIVLLMPVRHIPKLMKNLVKQNYHVVTNVTIGKPDPESAEISKLYYYGTEPLRKVELECQLRLMTAWTRGEGSIKNNKIAWDRKPIMPKEAVKSLPGQALREIDKYYIR